MVVELKGSLELHQHSYMEEVDLDTQENLVVLVTIPVGKEVAAKSHKKEEAQTKAQYSFIAKEVNTIRAINTARVVVANLLHSDIKGQGDIVVVRTSLEVACHDLNSPDYTYSAIARVRVFFGLLIKLGQILSQS